ncbi:MAG: MarR family transcriptional regulator [Myxococcota bacterium]
MTEFGPRLGDQLCFALYAASGALTRVYAPLLAPLGITYPQLLVMMALWERDDVSLSALAKRVHLAKSTMTPLIRRLEARGLVTRRRSAADERQSRIFLTAPGRSLAAAGQNVTQEAFCRTGLQKEEAEDLLKRCHLLLERIEEKA